MTDVTQSGPLMAADGTPLKRRLAQAMFRNRLRAFGLTAPLLAFISLFFFLPDRRPVVSGHLQQPV